MLKHNKSLIYLLHFGVIIFNPGVDQLNEVAEKNNVSFNMLVLQCCRYALDSLNEDNV